MVLYRGKVNCTNAKWEIRDKVSGLWERQDSCRAVAEKCKSLPLNVLIRDRSHLGRQLSCWGLDTATAHQGGHGETGVQTEQGLQLGWFGSGKWDKIRQQRLEFLSDT